MIGFINRADVPKLIIQFVLMALLFMLGALGVASLPVHGSIGIVLLLAVILVAFKVGEWAGEAIWGRIRYGTWRS